MLKEEHREEFWRLLFGVRRSIRYHERRQRFFENLNTWSLILALIVGSSSVSTVFWSRLAPFLPVWVGGIASFLGVVATVLALTCLVISPVRKANLHAGLARRFKKLEKRVVSASSRMALERATQKRLSIEVKEPPILRILDIKCHNELLQSIGYPKTEHIKLSFFQKKLANFIDIGFDRRPMENQVS